jgi:hypothetical protein
MPPQQLQPPQQQQMQLSSVPCTIAAHVLLLMRHRCPIALPATLHLLLLYLLMTCDPATHDVTRVPVECYLYSHHSNTASQVMCGKHAKCSLMHCRTSFDQQADRMTNGVCEGRAADIRSVSCVARVHYAGVWLQSLAWRAKQKHEPRGYATMVDVHRYPMPAAHQYAVGIICLLVFSCHGLMASSQRQRQSTLPAEWAMR